MMLVAWELGIGSVPATVYDQDAARRLLGLPAEQHCEYLLSFGYPADPTDLTRPPASGGRRDLAEVVREERWLREPRQAGRAYCQRNLRDAIPKQKTSQLSRTAAQTYNGANGAPPTMTWRSASARYVNGMARAMPCRNGGIWSIGKRAPDSNIIGN